MAEFNGTVSAGTPEDITGLSPHARVTVIHEGHVRLSVQRDGGSAWVPFYPVAKPFSWGSRKQGVVEFTLAGVALRIEARTTSAAVQVDIS